MANITIIIIAASRGKLTLIQYFSFFQMSTLPQHVRVCIIGGGVAGLGAAQELIQSGVDDILILEAQDRVGGRVFTLTHGTVLYSENTGLLSKLSVI